MKKVVITILLGTTCFLGCLTSRGNSAKNISSNERDHLFNAEWKFIRENPTGAEQPGYDDSKWLAVDLPHDYTIMDLPGGDDANQIGPFSKSSPGGGRDNGNVLGGTGWYRKHFIMNNDDAGKKVVLSFDGVYMETEVWVNGKPVGVNKYGYSPFWFDITKLLKPAGESNVIAVKVDNSGRNTRWYSGSGIYRNVHLTVTDPVHVAVWGVRVTTPKVGETSANVDVAVTVQNDSETASDAVVNVKILDKNNKTVGDVEKTSQVGSHASNNADIQINVSNPDLWSIETPNLYKAQVTITVNGKVTDTYIQSFGIRTLEFSVEKGFLLNGKSVKLYGACIHHDNGLLGSAAFDRAVERRVEIMKASGFNAIRCSHNPPSENFLDACDRIGMLVMDEFVDMWEQGKNPQDYSVYFREWWKKDLTNMVMRDRNHPSIILWSIGNEIPDKNTANGLRVGKELVDAFKELDNTRLVTEAVNGVSDAMEGVFAMLDVGGYNYAWSRYVTDHEKYPNRIIVGTESFPIEAFENWQQVVQHPYVIGDFVWTGWDYLGEVALGRSTYGAGGRGGGRGTGALGGGIMGGGQRGGGTQYSQRPSRQERLDAVESLEKQVATIRTQIEKAPSVDPNIANLTGSALTDFMNVYTPESNTINEMSRTLSSLSGTAAVAGGQRGGVGGLTTGIITELTALAKADNATKIAARLDVLAKEAQTAAAMGFNTNRSGSWPWFQAWCGDFDISGGKKPPMIYKDVLWDNSKLEIVVHAPIPEGQVENVGRWGWYDEWPHWNWKGNEGKALQVRVFTKGDNVKLELNGKLIGEKAVSIATEYIASFDVPYQPGELKATAYQNGNEIAVKSFKTTGQAVAVRLVTDRSTINADRNDLAYVDVEAVDENGQVVADAAVKVNLTLSGDGEIAASGNASPDDMESVNKPVIKTFHGKALAVIRPFAKAGTVTLKAESNGLKTGVVEISVK
jgi:hypothetical protein